MNENPGPNPDTKKPVLPLPSGACDCHAHVFGPRDLYPVKKDAGYEPATAPFTEYLKMLHAIGCSRAVLVQPSPYGTDNSAMLDALQTGKIPLRGVALIDESTTDQQLGALHEHGVQGVRLHLLPGKTEAVLATLPRLSERLRPFGMHLQFYLSAARDPEVDKSLINLRVPVVIDHFGLVPASGGVTSPGFKTLLRLAQNEKCWFKLSAPYRISEKGPAFGDVAPIAKALLEAAPNRCLWGTDWPHPNASFIPNDGDLVDLLAQWIPDEDLRTKVLVENPSRLYGF